MVNRTGGTVMADVKVNYKNILVPVDGSKEAEAALDRAIKVAKQNGADTNLHSTCMIRSFQMSLTLEQQWLSKLPILQRRH